MRRIMKQQPMMQVVAKRISLTSLILLAACNSDPTTKPSEPQSSADRADPAANFVVDHDWLVGGWVPQGTECATDTGMNFYATKNWRFSGETGTWKMDGRKIIRRKTGEENDDYDIVPVNDPHEYVTTIIDAQQDAFTSRTAGGRVLKWARCPGPDPVDPFTQSAGQSDAPSNDVRERWNSFAWQGSAGASIASKAGSSVSFQCEMKVNDNGYEWSESAVLIHPKNVTLKGDMTANFIVDGKAYSLTINNGKAQGGTRFADQEYLDIATAIQSSRSDYFTIEIPSVEWKDQFSTSGSKNSFDEQCS